MLKQGQEHFELDRKQAYLKSHDKYIESTHNCMICLDLATHPLKCKGCQSLFCRKCANTWRKQSNTCPKKCTLQWDLVQSPSTNLQLVCPYSPLCTRIFTPQSFSEHLKQCQHMPNIVRMRLQNRAKNLCSKNHKLSFFVDRFINHEQLKCDDCKQVSVCRVRCKECKVYYCSECRDIPLTKFICPMEHVLVYKNSWPGWTCDRCGLQPYYSNKKCHEDSTCKVGICEDCYQDLPLPPRHLILWVPDSEFNQHLKDSNSKSSTVSLNSPPKYDQEWEIDLGRDEWF